MLFVVGFVWVVGEFEGGGGWAEVLGEADEIDGVVGMGVAEGEDPLVDDFVAGILWVPQGGANFWRSGMGFEGFVLGQAVSEQEGIAGPVAIDHAIVVDGDGVEDEEVGVEHLGVGVVVDEESKGGGIGSAVASGGGAAGLEQRPDAGFECLEDLRVAVDFDIALVIPAGLRGDDAKLLRGGHFEEVDALLFLGEADFALHLFPEALAGVGGELDGDAIKLGGSGTVEIGAGEVDLGETQSLDVPLGDSGDFGRCGLVGVAGPTFFLGGFDDAEQESGL